MEKTLSKKQKTVYSAAAILVFLVLVYLGDTLIPMTSQWNMLMTVIKKGAIFALVAVSMNLLNGFTGLFSLGQAGFMLIGAYAYAIFSIPAAQHDAVYQYFNGGLFKFSVPEILMNALGGEGSFGGFLGEYAGIFILIIFAGLLTGGIAYLIGIPVLRLKSDYLAIATLGFAEILRAVFQWNAIGPVTNGSNILREFTTYETALFPIIFSGICIALIVLLINSTYGRAFKAIRDDEIAAEAMGVNLFKHKELAFVISSFFAGVGGALLAMFQNSATASTFTTNMTYEILLIVVIGGIGSITGSIIGSFIFIGLNEWLLRGLDQGQWLGIQSTLMRAGFRKVVFAILIMLVVLFFAKGIMGNKEFSWDGIIRWFKTLPQRIKAWPAKKKAQLAERKEQKEAKKEAKAKAAEKKAKGAEALADGEKLFTPLPVYDHVVVFEKEVQ
ncbi:aBC-type branched-chain amino acid transport system permease component [Firmicutes bacterium CAG:238]|nr:aBC-type branched-chain amino acid transport system permease component [Firmicutes bacterium CAG:238]